MAKHNPKTQMTELCSSPRQSKLRTAQGGLTATSTAGSEATARIDVADKEFDPPAEMMVNDFDDERTLDEEEALEGSEDPQTELNSLQKEGDMPLDELLAMYGYSGDPSTENVKSSSSDISNHDSVMETDEISPDMEEESDVKDSPSELEQLYNLPEKEVEESPGTSRLLRLSRPQSEEEEDYDYSPDEEEWGKTIMVGSDYQAAIPEGLCKYDDALPYENEDKLLWNPMSMSEEAVEKFLVKAQEPLVNNAIPTGNHTRDDEQALYLLLQCGYNCDEALRRRRMNVVPPTDKMSLWSEEECRNFENGLRTYGKDFHLIQQNKVRTRSVGELVQFYYLWKKTERHDIFANKARLEKKKYTLHPGITDYMDRFLEEQDGSGTNRDRSSSPNVQCLIYGDPKRHRTSESVSASTATNAPLSSPADPLSNLAKDNLESAVSLTEPERNNTIDKGKVTTSTSSSLNSVEMAFASTAVLPPSTLLIPVVSDAETSRPETVTQ